MLKTPPVPWQIPRAQCEMALGVPPLQASREALEARGAAGQGRGTAWVAGPYALRPPAPVHKIEARRRIGSCGRGGEAARVDHGGGGRYEAARYGCTLPIATN